MDSTQNEPNGMAYSHLGRDPTSISQTPFQSHQSLNQALGNHLPPQRAFPDNYRLSTSPPPINDQGPGFALHAAKRKPDSGGSLQHAKRRREGDDDGDDGAHGAKHWTDEEKTKLFSWLMAPGEEEHWNALRATKNSCLRECAVEVFGGKKTYQALKGCYERNFNVFKQIYAFEAFNAHLGSGPINTPNEAERLREYERRLLATRKAGCDVGGINARTIDHWYRVGWYSLFFQRWHGDPAATKPTVHRNITVGPTTPVLGDEVEMDDEDYGDMASRTADRSQSISFSALQPPLPSLQPKDPMLQASPSTATASGSSLAPPDQTLVNLTVTQGIITTCVQLLQAQAQDAKIKVEYMRKREEREENESRQRWEAERLRMEREKADWERVQQAAKLKQKVDMATELLANPNVDGSVKQAAGDYLKKLFLSD